MDTVLEEAMAKVSMRKDMYGESVRSVSVV